MRHLARRTSGTRTPRRACITVTVWLSLLGLLAACGGTASSSGPNGAAAPPGFPVTVTNCGATTMYQHPPERVVAFGSTIEIMLALGLEERMVGTAYASAEDILPHYRDEYRRIPSLAAKLPSYEALLKVSPDFVYGAHGGAFSEQEGRSRERLREAGINAYLNLHECEKGPVTMQHVWREIRTVAKIFNVTQRAEELIGRLKGELAAATHELAGVDSVSVFVYDSGTSVPMTAGGHGIGNEIIRLAGGSNIFSGVPDEFFDASWEQVIQRRPEWIVIMDYGSTSVQEKKQTLLSKPSLANVPAIKHHRFAVLELSSAYLGVRAPGAVGELAEQLYPGRFQ